MPYSYTADLLTVSVTLALLVCADMKLLQLVPLEGFSVYTKALFKAVFLSGLNPQFVYAPPEIPERSPGLWVLIAVGIIDTAEELKE